MRAPPLLRRALLPGLLVLLATPAAAGIFGRRDKAPEEPVDTDPPEPVGPPPLQDAGPLWDHPLPLPLGPLPRGLANVSAQGCHGCHWEAHEGWSAGPHASGPTEVLRLAAADAGTPACLQCHLPLQEQHDRLWVGTPGAPPQLQGPNAAYAATLVPEGVTCAACHVRDGHVIGTSERVVAPHPGRHGAQLGTATACATCHQLTWPGAEQPLYDTFGEWQRSAWATAGITCQDCHMRPGPSGGTVRHGVALPADRAVSVLVDLPPAAIVRGGGPVEVDVTLQNTGAGHAWPTGSPFRGMQLQVDVEGPPGDDGPTTWGTGLRAPLQRTLEEAPPWRTTADTRLPAGGQRTWSHRLTLPVDAPTGRYLLRVRLVPTLAGEPDGAAVVERKIPLRVE